MIPILLSISCLWAQSHAQPAPSTRADDEAAIRKTALNYVEGWYEGSADRMRAALHPQLAKRISSKDKVTGEPKLQEMTADQLIEAAGKGGGNKTPVEKQIKEVKILDIFGNTASVRAEMAGWIDYMHMAKINGEWKIVNVLWELKPKS
jgi:hypothetical protein